MSRKLLYFAAALLILLIVHLQITADQKGDLFSVTSILLWMGIAGFWSWVYIQSRTRRLFVSKVVIMIIALSLGVMLRHTMKILDIDSSLISDLISASVASVVAIETWDLWQRSGKQAKNVEATEKRDDER